MGWISLSPTGPHHDLSLPLTALFSFQVCGLLNFAIRGKQTLVAREECVLLVPLEPLEISDVQASKQAQGHIGRT